MIQDQLPGITRANINGFLRHFSSLPFLRQRSHRLKRVYPDDVMIVGYPKSGNTWLRFLIGNYLTNGDCSFMNYARLVPVLEDGTAACDATARPRFIHSHFPYPAFLEIHPSYRQQLPHIVFITRDGRDVAVSYYFHLIKHHQLASNTSFGEYLQHLDAGIFYPHLCWGAFIDQWLDMLPAGGGNWSLIRYEDLLADPAGEFSRFLSFVGINPDPDRIKVAVDASSFENMKQMEEKQEDGHTHLKDTDKSIRFVRRGGVSQWIDYFDAEMTADFGQANARALILLGYAA